MDKLLADNVGSRSKYIVKRPIQSGDHGPHGAQWVGCGTWQGENNDDWNAREAAFKKARQVAAEYGTATLEQVICNTICFRKGG